MASNLSANLCAKDDVRDGDELNETTDQAALADLLGDATLRVARHEIGDDADAAVVEASKQAVLKCCGHVVNVAVESVSWVVVVLMTCLHLQTD